MLPKFIIIGAQKSATSYLQECLREHPQIFMPRGEIPFFETDHYAEDRIQELEGFFVHTAPGEIPGFKRADLLGHPECPERIHRHIPEAKLITVIRNPVERAVSAYLWYVKMGLLPLIPLNEALAKIATGGLQERYPRAQEILDYGYYHRNLERYLRFFHRNKLLVLRYDELEEDKLVSLEKVYSFLDIQRSYVPRALHKTPKRSVYSTFRLRFLNLGNRFVYGDNENRARLARRGGGLRKLAIYSVAGVDRFLLAPVFSRDKSNLEPTVRRKLIDLYHDDLLALESMLGDDFSSWRDKSRTSDG
jgi:hypothetical protein